MSIPVQIVMALQLIAYTIVALFILLTLLIPSFSYSDIFKATLKYVPAQINGTWYAPGLPTFGYLYTPLNSTSHFEAITAAECKVLTNLTGKTGPVAESLQLAAAWMRHRLGTQQRKLDLDGYEDASGEFAALYHILDRTDTLILLLSSVLGVTEIYVDLIVRHNRDALHSIRFTPNPFQSRVTTPSLWLQPTPLSPQQIQAWHLSCSVRTGLWASAMSVDHAEEIAFTARTIAALTARLELSDYQLETLELVENTTSWGTMYSAAWKGVGESVQQPVTDLIESSDRSDSLNYTKYSCLLQARDELSELWATRLSVPYEQLWKLIRPESAIGWMWIGYAVGGLGLLRFVWVYYVEDRI